MSREVKNVLVAAAFVDVNNQFAAASGFVDTGQDLEVSPNALVLEVAPDIDLDPARTLVLFSVPVQDVFLAATVTGTSIVVTRFPPGNGITQNQFYIAIYTSQT